MPVYKPLKHEELHRELKAGIRPLNELHTLRVSQLAYDLLDGFDAFVKRFTKADFSALVRRYESERILLAALRFKLLRSPEIGPFLIKLAQIDPQLSANALNLMAKHILEKYR
ncbi:MAG: hypothetical protein COT14_03705 [Candidatus Diapherotrites archaeon CG08_land_8_20_14_0_20_30_16]|nr:MAG: hypothetical protein COT14_03705 [Candidatus Diapherotrites archaeon CG08_land_8_20_14_0_20_30_16]